MHTRLMPKKCEDENDENGSAERARQRLGIVHCNRPGRELQQNRLGLIGGGSVEINWLLERTRRHWRQDSLQQQLGGAGITATSLLDQLLDDARGGRLDLLSQFRRCENAPAGRPLFRAASPPIRLAAQ